MIIPTLNESRTLGATLKRLGHHPDVEIIVVDGGSEDGTVTIARAFPTRVLQCTRGRARQMNAGAAAARGHSLYFLHADTLPPRDWLPLLRDHGDLPCCFRLRFAGDHRLLRLYAWFTRFNLNAFRFGDQSLWVTRRDFQRVGGFPAEWQLLEDNELARRLRSLRGGFRVLPQEVVTSPRKYLQYGIVRTQIAYVLLYIAYRLGVGQALLHRLYCRLLDLGDQST